MSRLIIYIICLLQSPTLSPTPPRYCPDQYDRAKRDYVAGDQVESDGYIFQCQSAPYETYCNHPDFLPAMLKEDPEAKLLWINAWSFVMECFRTETPTTSPTLSLVPSSSPSSAPSLSINPSASPSSSPSQTPSSVPSLEPTHTPTLSPSNSPTYTPTLSPTLLPSFSPTMEPSFSPTLVRLKTILFILDCTTSMCVCKLLLF